MLEIKKGGLDEVSRISAGISDQRARTPPPLLRTLNFNAPRSSVSNAAIDDLFREKRNSMSSHPKAKGASVFREYPSEHKRGSLHTKAVRPLSSGSPDSEST